MSDFIDENGGIIDPYRNFIALSRYARWNDELGRRETWKETVERYNNFFQRYLDESYPLAEIDLDKEGVHAAILNHEVMPSMRSLMTAGPALERDHTASYNCSFMGIDHPRSFDEAMYILMCGTGVGFSVESKYIDKLPVINEHFEKTDTTIVVADSKAGWARALRELLALLWQGQIPSWDVSRVRPAGARLKTFGGRASGPEPLERLFKFCVEIFKNAAGRKLKPIEAHDIMCKIGEVVVVGGVRRCLLDHTDVTTPTGFVKMKDIAVGDEIVSGGRKAHVIAKMDSGKQLTVIVNHQYGKSEMTPNHRIAVFDGIDSYTFKEAGDLVPGDRLVWDLVGYYGDVQALPRPSYVGHFNAKPFTVPDIVDTDVAWLIGLVHGDGHIHAKGIEISSNDGEWATLERANAIFTDTFGVGGNVGPDSHDGKGIRLRINSTGLALWFAENVKLPNEPIRVPSFIMRAQPDVRAAYLAGVLDSDGRIKSDGVIEQATSVYPEFIDDLRLVNMSLGLTMKVVQLSAQHRRDRGENAKDYQTLNVAGRTSRDSFINVVGPHSEKMDGLDVSKSGSPKDFTYPAEWRVGYHNRNTQRTTLVQKGLLESDYPFAPVEVVSVEIGSVQQTWDIEVADIHEFTADGLVTHNSAMISLSNLEDYDMAKAKAGSWWDTNGQRALANNSAVYESKPGVGEFLKEWRHLYDSKSGERGIFSLSNAQRTAASSGRRDGSKVMGTNPSLVAGTLVWTDGGIRPIEELAGKEFKVTNIEGEQSEAVCWKSGENVPVHGVVVTGGHRYLATAEHKWPVLRKNEWVRVKTLDLKPGDTLPNIERDTLYPDGTEFTYSDGFLVGWNIGSGERFQTAREKSKIRYHYIVDPEVRDYVVPQLDRGLNAVGTATRIKKLLRSSERELETAELYAEPVRQLFRDTGDGDMYDGLPQVVWDATTSEEFRHGIVDAIISSSAFFDANHQRITVVSEHEKVVNELSSLLGFYGIKTSVERVGASPLKSKDSVRVFAMHVIGGMKDMSRLLAIFPLSNKMLEREILNKVIETDYYEPFGTVNVLEVNRNAGRQDVWDITVYDWSHAFQIDHCVTGNCGEILLRNKGFCNLSEVVVSSDDTLDDLKRKVRVASIIGTIQSTMTNFKYLRKTWKDNAEEERLLGVSLTGQFGHPVLSGSEGVEKLRLWLSEMKSVAIKVNLEYSEKLGINQSAAITTVKPSGCRPKDALTTTNDGILTLEEMMDLSGHQPGEEWADLGIGSPTGTITKTYDNGKAEVFAVRTDFGIEVRSTGNHQWAVENKGWVRTDELEPGDVIESQFGTYTSNSNVALYSPEEYPSSLVPEVAWLLGVIAATGRVTDDGLMRIPLRRPEAAETVKEVLTAHFGIDDEVVRTSKAYHRYAITVSDGRFMPWLEDNGLVAKNEVPTMVRSSSRESVIAYVAGLCDGYGMVGGEKARAFIYLLDEDYSRHLQSVTWAVGLNMFRSNNLETPLLGRNKDTQYVLGTTGASNHDDIETFRKYCVRGQNHRIWLENERSHAKAVHGRVREIEPIGEMETYDIEVEGSHYYYDSGLKSHNTVSQLTSVSSGMHPWHSQQYIRSVRGDNKDPLTRFLRDAGIPNEPDVMKPLDTTVFYFPVQAPENSITRNDITAVEHLNIWKTYKQYWTEHNPSITVTVREHEWVDVASWVYANWEDVGGISFLPHSDHTYKQAPYQEVSSDEFKEFLSKMPDKIYWDELSFYESEDMTTGSQELACSAGACDIVEIGSVTSDES